MASNETDIEKGLRRTSDMDITGQNSSRKASTGMENMRASKTDLEIFQTLVGIHFLAPGGGPHPDPSKQVKPAGPLTDIFLPTKAAENRFRNRGLYDRVLSQDIKNRTMYTIARYVVIFLYLFQIVIAATFTALSAYQKSSVSTLTSLGAINTVVAGMLAWITGQGMPVRFRRARDQYREVVKAIENAERLFSEIEYIHWPPGGRPDPIREQRRLERMYEEARVDQEANYPETQTEPSAHKDRQENEGLKEKANRKKEETSKEIESLKKDVQGLRDSSSGFMNDLRDNAAAAREAVR